VSLIDPKPAAAFIEYTLKPIIEDARDLIDLMEKNGMKASDISDFTWKLFIFDRLIAGVTSIIVTGFICYTALRIL
jgi:hypothetical protein